jgi:hypothetical protein
MISLMKAEERLCIRVGSAKRLALTGCGNSLESGGVSACLARREGISAEFSPS